MWLDREPVCIWPSGGPDPRTRRRAARPPLARIALVHTARVLDQALRTEDAIGRWGGEEFLVVLPGTDEEGALHATERLRAALAIDQPAEARAPGLRVTITIGVAEWCGDTADELVPRADKALYVGKAAGRDTVHVASGTGAIAEAAGPA